MREPISATNRVRIETTRGRPLVDGSVRARRQPRSALAVTACREAHAAAPGVLESKMEQLDRVLAQILPDAGSVVVQDKVVGFRLREKRRVLRVEIFGGEQAGTSVVPIGAIAALDKTIDDGRSFQPDSLRSDLVDVRRVFGAPPQRFD